MKAGEAGEAESTGEIVDKESNLVFLLPRV